MALLVRKEGAYPSYNDRAWTMVGSFLDPSTNSSNVSLASLSRSMALKILSTLCAGMRIGPKVWPMLRHTISGVCSSAGSLTICPVIL
jgi:hypothetical protein